MKKIHPGTKIVFGGSHSSVFSKEILNGNECIDVITRGEYEKTLLHLAERLKTGGGLSEILGITYRHGEAIKSNPDSPLIESLDKLPFPAYDMFPAKGISGFADHSAPAVYWDGFCQHRPAIQMHASRGCPYKCDFCLWNQVMYRNGKYRAFSVERILSDIEEVIKRYGQKEIYFDDDTFTLSKRWLLELCGLLRKEVPGIIWNCQARVASLDDDMLKAMVASGCIQVGFDIESCSPKVLQALKKMQSPEDIKETFRLCKKYPIRTMANFIIGNPEETLADIDLTAALAQELKADYTEFFILTPYPGTNLYEMAERNGWILGGDAFYGRESNRPVMSINFKPNEMVTIRKNLYEENLNSIWKRHLLDPHFIMNVLKFTFSRPSVIPGYASVLWREKSLAELGRHINTEMSMYYIPPPPGDGGEAGT